MHLSGVLVQSQGRPVALVEALSWSPVPSLTQRNLRMVWPWQCTTGTRHVDSGVAQSTSSQPSQQQPSSDTVNEAVVPVLHSIAENKSTDAASAKYSLVCDKRKDILDKDPTVKFMLQKLEEAGCKLPEDRIALAECEPGYLGRYLRHGLEICYNNYQDDPDELRNTIVHELVHAYDECRGKDFDWTNCRHIACSEIRAARLSGDCSMWMEFKRGNLPWPGYEKACVRRRAELSVASMSHCKLSSLAAVLSNFDACYNDTTPFSRPP